MRRGHTRPNQTLAPLPGIVQHWDGSSLHWGVIILDLLQRWNGGKDMSGLQWGGKTAPWKWLCLGILWFKAVWVLEGKSICQTCSNPDVFSCFQALLSLSSFLHLPLLSFPCYVSFPPHLSIHCFLLRLGLPPAAVPGSCCLLHLTAFLYSRHSSLHLQDGS